MAPQITPEAYFERLKQMAVNRFGEERVKVLAPALQEISAALAEVARFDLRENEEPAFFL